MKKVRLKEDVSFIGFGILRKGTEFKVDSYNSRYVYVKTETLTTIRLSVKDVDVIY